MSVPSRDPVLVTVNRTVALLFRDTVGVTDRLLRWNVVYDSPYPNGYSGL
jgi:hypothetical protein